MPAKITSDIKKKRQDMVLSTKPSRTAGLPVSLKATDTSQQFHYHQQGSYSLLGNKALSNTKIQLHDYFQHL